ncbi:MAG: CpXC domain-containing protein [Halobacteriales archaeon]|nr:CpXC domain-containing protein [Halobacteriales archaeon]
MAVVRILPQSKALSVRLGIALGVLGIVLVLVSFSGSFAYDIAFFYLAIAGVVIGLYGMVLLANSRVLSTKRPRRAAHAEPVNPLASREWVRLQCPSCGNVFETEGTRPFRATCPRCQAAGLIA